MTQQVTSIRIITLSIILALVQRSYSFGVGEIVDVIEIGNDVARNIYKTYEVVSTNIDTHKDQQFVDVPYANKRQQAMLRYILEVSRKVSEITNSLNHLGDNSIYNLVQQFPSTVKLELQQNELSDLITKVNIAHSTMMTYANDEEIEQVTLEDFAQRIVSHDVNSIRTILERIFHLVVSDDNGFADRGILKLLSKAMEEAEYDVCNLHQSPQQLLYNLYQTLALTELKGYAMMQFSYMLMKLYNKGNMTREVSLMREAYETRSENLIRAATLVMTNASRELWICDPKKHISGETFIEVTQLLQGYIENEVDMSKDASCTETCDSYSVAKNNGCFKNLYCSQQRSCKGKILNCKYYDADMWICPGSMQSGRRYQYIEYENGRVLGQKDYCARGTTKVDSWWRWLFWRCSYCFCLCDEQSPTSDRYFNLRNTESDYTNNKVVTGLRFVKVNRVIHLQIQQGELLPKARIDESTIEWVPVDGYRITDNGIYAGDDYHTLTYENRAIDLDELLAKPDQVVTGVRFRKIGSHLNFELQVCPFNFTTGKLIDPKNLHIWISNDNTDADIDNPRHVLRLKDPDIPTRTKAISVPDSRANQFLHFVNTDIDKDAAQTTVPFIDAQMVVPQIAVPLSGAGIYHKGQPGYGGFIAPKVMTFDYTPHVTKPPKIVEAEVTNAKVINTIA